MIDATGQSKFYKYCMSAHKMQTIVSSDALLLVDVATPDTYRKMSESGYGCYEILINNEMPENEFDHLAALLPNLFSIIQEKKTFYMLPSLSNYSCYCQVNTCRFSSLL